MENSLYVADDFAYLFLLRTGVEGLTRAAVEGTAEEGFSEAAAKEPLPFAVWTMDRMLDVHDSPP